MDNLFTLLLYFVRTLRLLTVLSRPNTINLYDGFVGHDDVVAVAVTSD